MAKEKITLDAIKHDFSVVVKYKFKFFSDDGLVFFIIYTPLIVLLNVFLKSIIEYIFYIFLPIYLYCAYSVAVHIIGYCKYRKDKKAVSSICMREQISISTEIFSNKSSERALSGRTTRQFRCKYNFKSGAFWEIPWSIDEHYSWSSEARFSTSGIDNITSEGDEFIFVSMQGNPDIAYVYPCEVFELDKILILKEE